MKSLALFFLFFMIVSSGCMAPVNQDPFAALFEPEPEIVYQPPLLELPSPLIVFRAEPWPYYGYGIDRHYYYGHWHHRHWRHHYW